MTPVELLRAATLVLAMIATGLTAGLLYAFAGAVMPGLGRTDDRTFVGAFQAIDRAIINPLFLVIFVGAVGFPALAAVLHFGADQPAVLGWTLAALVLSLATFVITRVVHLPLNAEIKSAGDPDRRADLPAARARFEPRWVRWNVVRTVTSTAAVGCLALALLTTG